MEAEGWTLASTSGTDQTIAVSISDEVVHGGNLALRVAFANDNGASRQWVRDMGGLVPGATYEVSWWWYSANGLVYTTSRMQWSAGGQSGLFDATTNGGPTGEWVRFSRTFSSNTSFVRLLFSVYGNRRAGDREEGVNVFYVDDVEIRKL